MNRFFTSESQKEIDKAIADYDDEIKKNPMDAGAYFKRGGARLLKLDYDTAISDLTRAIELNPKNAMAYSNRGQAWIWKANYQNAAADLDKAITLDPNLALAYVVRGILGIMESQVDRAATDLTKAIELDPQLASAYYFRGSVWVGKNQLDQAIGDFTKVIELDIKGMLPPWGSSLTKNSGIAIHAVAYFQRGLVRAVKKEYDAAILDYTQAIKLYPEFAEAYGVRGATWNDAKKDYDKAIADYTKAIELEPTNVSFLIHRGYIWHDAKKDYDKAIADYTKAIELEPKNARVMTSRGNAWKAKKDYEKAIADFDLAIILDPGYARAYDLRGDAWDAKKDHDKAIADYTKAIELDPKNSTYLVDRGNVWHDDKKDYDKAIADYTKAIELEPRNARIKTSRGNAWKAKKDFEKAVADFDQAIILDPAYARAYELRGGARRAKKNYDEAIADYTKAIELDPTNATYLFNRGHVWNSDKKKYGEAIADYTKVIELDPKFVVAYNNLGWILATCPDSKFRDGIRAVESATRACELTDWKNVGYIDTLAAAFAENGRFQEAVDMQERALRMLPSMPSLRSEEANFLKRLNLYKERKPHREQPSFDGKTPGAAMRPTDTGKDVASTGERKALAGFDLEELTVENPRLDILNHLVKSSDDDIAFETSLLREIEEQAAEVNGRFPGHDRPPIPQILLVKGRQDGSGASLAALFDKLIQDARSRLESLRTRKEQFGADRDREERKDRVKVHNLEQKKIAERKNEQIMIDSLNEERSALMKELATSRQRIQGLDSWISFARKQVGLIEQAVRSGGREANNNGLLLVKARTEQNAIEFERSLELKRTEHSRKKIDRIKKETGPLNSAKPNPLGESSLIPVSYGPIPSPPPPFQAVIPAHTGRFGGSTTASVINSGHSRDVLLRVQDLYASNLGIHYRLVPYGLALGAQVTRSPELGSPLGHLQLGPGDMIIALDGIPFREPIDIQLHYSQTQINFVRRNQTSQTQSVMANLGPRNLVDYHVPSLGICYVLFPYGDALGARLTRYPNPGSPCARLRLEPGDMIVSLDGLPIRGHQDVAAHIHQTIVNFIDIRTGELKSDKITLPLTTTASRIAPNNE